jgi:hypothetical protein
VPDPTFVITETVKWVLGGVATGIVTLVGGAIAFVYRIGVDRAGEWERHYKESRVEIEGLRQANRAEIESLRLEIRTLRAEVGDLRSKPNDLFKEYLANIEGMFIEKIKNLHNEAIALQERLRERESQLVELKDSQDRDQLRVDSLEESKKKLEDKLLAYGSVIQQLLIRQETAGVVMNALNGENLITGDLPVIEEKLRQRLSAIDGSPMPKTRALARRSLDARNAMIAKAEREARARSKARDEKEVAQTRKLAIELPPDAASLPKR